MTARAAGLSFWDFFNARRRTVVAPADAGLAADDTPAPGTGQGSVERQGVFVTPQSLTSFAGASAAVSGLWSLAVKIRPEWSGNTAVGLVIATVIGLVIYIISERDPANTGKKPGDRAISFFVAAINTAFLFSAALGVTGSAGGTGTTSRAPAAAANLGEVSGAAG